MIKKDTITEIINDRLQEEDAFIVSLSVSSSNSIVLVLDAYNGVSIDFCVEINRLIESNFDREVEDYSLEVSSAGLGQPFKVLEQYQKNKGEEVTVTPNGSKPLTGILKEVNSEGIVLATEEFKKIEGTKKKELVVTDQPFLFDDIVKTELVVKFK